MPDIAIRQLKDNISDIIRRVEAGEEFTVTVGRRPVARLGAVPRKRRWIPIREAETMFDRRRADPGLQKLLDEVFSETVDQVGDPWR